MKKLNKKQIREITKKLKPFWERYWKLYSNFLDKKEKLEKEMNKKINLGIELEFFHVDNECVGIGAEHYGDRKKFPLIHDSELGF